MEFYDVFLLSKVIHKQFEQMRFPYFHALCRFDRMNFSS